MDVVIREIQDPSDPAIAGFGRLQRAVYSDPDALIPSDVIPIMLEQQTHDRRNLLLVAEADGQVVGGTFFHALFGPNVGFSSFLGVARSVRGEGVARRLHDARLSALDRVAGRPVRGLFIDVVDPARMTPQNLEREVRVGSDPRVRRLVFDRFGFRKVDIRYEQPVGGPGGGPITVLDLLFCPREPIDAVPTSLVVATMSAYWTPWLGRTAARRHARELERRAGGRALLPLLPCAVEEPPG